MNGQVALMRESYLESNLGDRELFLCEERFRAFHSSTNHVLMNGDAHGLAERSLAMGNAEAAGRRDLWQGETIC